MRVTLLIVMVAACGVRRSSTNLDASCPPPDPGISGDATEGTPCSLSEIGQLCFVENEFSSCASAWYRCTAGRWNLDHELGVAAGASCTNTPLASCAYEGHPDCSALPTHEGCDCGSDGTWHCQCGCYGGQTTCDLTCPSEFPGVGSNGPACSDAGATCTYPGHTCTCTNGQFSCS
jgi:hypothetical protein